MVMEPCSIVGVDHMKMQCPCPEEILSVDRAVSLNCSLITCRAHMERPGMNP